MWAVISPVLFGGFAISAIEPIESESPKIKSASVSIRGRGWAPPDCCCIGGVFRNSVYLVFRGQPSWIARSWNWRPNRVDYRCTGIVLARDCLRLRIRKEVMKNITPAWSNDPATKVNDATVGPASARE